MSDTPVPSPVLIGTVKSFDPVIRVDPATGAKTAAFIAHAEIPEVGIASVFVGCSPEQVRSGLTADYLRAFGFGSIEDAAKEPDTAVDRTVALRQRESDQSRISWVPVTARRAKADDFLAVLAAQQAAPKAAKPIGR